MQAQATEPVTGTERPPTDWQSVDWRKANRMVRNLRQRIFRATQADDWNKVRSLQKLMLRSYSNTLVSVRRVAQENTGKRTPGVDKLVVKTPALRGRLVDLLMTSQPWRARPARRIYIPKANSKLRPLGIPTILDRCLQARVKNALEPSWEARFEGTSYGFRPGRGCHDAIGRVYRMARSNTTKPWVVDADIKGAFDHISHRHLLNTIGDVPGKELIKQWLKAGYVDNGVFFETDEGTPQGGVASPLLANIALHGMEEALGVTYDKRGQTIGTRGLAKYADDFVVFCQTREDAEQVIRILTTWLAERGLTLSPEKTRIVHLDEGFDFLGYHVRQHKDLRTRTGRKLLIRPSKEAVKKLRDTLKAIWIEHKGKATVTVCQKLNPIIRGWANYHRVVVSYRTFRALDDWMFKRACQWARHRHPKKPISWRSQRYWGRLNRMRADNWVFGDKRSGCYLLKFRWFQPRWHAMVKGTASPDDPRLREYWQRRLAAKAAGLKFKQQRLARNQNFRCMVCGEALCNDEELQIHHLLPKGDPQRNEERYQKLIHLLCHQQLTKAQLQSNKRHTQSGAGAEGVAQP